MEERTFIFNIPKDNKEAFRFGYHYGELIEQIYLLRKGVRRVFMVICLTKHSEIFERFMEKENLYFVKGRCYIKDSTSYSVSSSKRYLKLFNYFDKRIVDKKTNLFSYTIKNKICDFIVGLMLGYSGVSCVKYILNMEEIK